MSERGNIQAQLNAGIEAVHAGDRETARKLLQQVIRADPRNEVAWMWMASAVTDPDERRACLERALQINPENTRAKEALRRLELTNPREPGSRAPTNSPRAGGSSRSGNIYLALAVVVLVVVVAAVVFAISNSSQPTALGTTANGTSVPGVGLVPTQGPTIDPTTFTATPNYAVVVTIDRSQSSLPPTFTPTFTPLPSATTAPTPTPPPLNTYSLLYGDTSGQVYQLKGDGSGELALPSSSGTLRDIAVDPSGQRIAFVRDVLDSTDATEQASVTSDPNATPPVGPIARPQLFVASVSNLNEARQMTTLPGTQLERPSWSPDGNSLAFGSDATGNLDIYTVPVEGGAPQRLTTNTGIDKDPAWSPNGAQIAYASDQNSPTVRKFPGTTEIFLINADGTGSITELTNAGGNSFWPSWSPDGKQIVFVSDRSGDSDLYVMSAQGDGQDLITYDDQGAEDRAPSYSTDGLWIVFTSNRETPNFQTYLIDPAGNAVKRVTQNDRDIEAVSFLPTGS